jgi:PPK2 family polyphosphate:nucleotide phosphotransferase
MKTDIEIFCVEEGKKVNLKKVPTSVKPLYIDKDDYKRQKEKHIHKFNEMQELFYSYSKYALLIIFQGMDAAGKDGAISHVMSGVNPEGCQTFNFKQPSAEDLEHDFFWREYKCLPERGRIGIFNRSYYEDVLVVKVHPEILNNQQLPPELTDKNKVWKNRYRSIVDIERHLYNNGTRIIKFFLHISEDEQKKRFLERIDQPDKNWKFGAADFKEREFWNDYMKAYEECISNTSTQRAPWYIIPADDKENARIIISQIINSKLKKFKMNYPIADDEKKKELLAIRDSLTGKENKSKSKA